MHSKSLLKKWKWSVLKKSVIRNRAEQCNFVSSFRLNKEGEAPVPQMNNFPHIQTRFFGSFDLVKIMPLTFYEPAFFLSFSLSLILSLFFSLPFSLKSTQNPYLSWGSFSGSVKWYTFHPSRLWVWFPFLWSPVFSAVPEWIDQCIQFTCIAFLIISFLQFKPLFLLPFLLFPINPRILKCGSHPISLVH